MKVNFKKYFAILLMFFTIVIGTASWVIVGEKSFIAGQHSVSSAVAYIIGKESIKYTSIEKALDVAVSGDIVVVVPPTLDNYHDTNNKVTPDKVTYYITRDCEIKEDVSLVIPTDAKTLSTVTDKSSLNTYITSMYTDVAERNKGANSTYGSYATDNNYLRVIVEIEENVTLINNGTLIVSGYLSGGTNTMGLIGQTAHSFSKIILGNNARITQNNSNAITYCFGYISEKIDDDNELNDSIFEINNGKLYVPFIVNDYRGFGFSWAMTDGAINTYRCSPFNQFEFKNIDTLIIIKYNALIYGISNTYVNFVNSSFNLNINKVFTNILGVVGNDETFFVQQSDFNNSMIKFKYNKKTEISNIKFYGGMVLNDFELKLKESFVTVDLSTTSAYFPISYKFNLELFAMESQELAVFDVSNQRIKLLPGSSLTVNENCKLIGNELLVYTAFYDGELGNGQSSSNEYYSVKYPLKEGAIFKSLSNSIVDFEYIAGTVYGNQENFEYTYNEISAREAWVKKSSGKTNPAWTIKDYLIINEKLDFKSLTDLSKNKIYAAVNTFSSYPDYLPSYNVIINNSTIENVSKYQRVVHYENINDYKIEFLSNIYKFKYSTKDYLIDSTISYSKENSLVCAINSTVSILNTADKNEFRVQSIEIECTTPLVDGKIPLYVGTTVNLKANINDIAKIYDKTIVWESLDETIAIVDEEGNVTGVSLGSVVIRVYCDGQYAEKTLNVIEEATIEKIESISISDNKGNTGSGSYNINTSLTFYVNINPESATYGKIEWTLESYVPSSGDQGTNPGIIYINDANAEKNKGELPNYNSETTTSINVTISNTSTGGTADHARLTCVVTDPYGNPFTAYFVITINASVCFTPDTLVTMGDGNQKQIKDIVPGEEILSFNHYTGKYESTKIAMLVNHGFDEYSILDLRFNNGERLKFINQHGLFDVELKKYVNITLENYKECIGRTYLQYDSKTNSNKEVILENINIETEYTEAYSILSSRNINAVTNNILSMSTGTPGIYNIFELDDNYMVDKELMLQDIEKYGLVTYEEYKDYVPYELFYDFNFEYLNISIAKGLITEEEIARQIEWYYQMIENGEIII